MASIKKRPDGRYRARYRGPDGRERVRHFERKVDAEKWVSTQTADARGEWLDPDRTRITLGEWAKVWRQSKVDLRPSSHARLDATLEHHVLPTFKDRRLHSIGNADVRAWVTDMEAAGLSPSSVRKAYNAL